MTYDHGGNLFAVAGELGVRSEEMIDFSASINPLGMPQGVRDAVIGGVDRLVHYPYPYAEPLRAALADFHKVSPEQIVPANGTTELIYLLPRAIPGNRALIVAPAFSEYEKALSVAGWEIGRHFLLPSERFDLDIASLAGVLADNTYRMLFLCNPGNPTGRLYSLDDIAAVAALCRERGVLLVLDEAFIDFCGEDASAISAGIQGEEVVVLRSMTKFYAIPGLRLGYAVAGPATAAALSRASGPWRVNSLAVAAGLAALSDGDFRRQTMEYIAAARLMLVAGLSAVPWLSPFAGAANYLLLRLAPPAIAGELAGRLLGKRLLIRDCGNFRGLDDSFVRVAVRRFDENEQLVAALGSIIV